MFFMSSLFLLVLISLLGVKVSRYNFLVRFFFVIKLNSVKRKEKYDTKDYHIYLHRERSTGEAIYFLVLFDVMTQAGQIKL